MRATLSPCRLFRPPEKVESAGGLETGAAVEGCCGGAPLSCAGHTPEHSNSARHTARKHGRIRPIIGSRFVYFDDSSSDLSCTRKSLPHFKLPKFKHLNKRKSGSGSVTSNLIHRCRDERLPKGPRPGAPGR